MRPFTVAEARALIAATETDRLGTVYRLALTLGLRQGEVLGLSWEDVDLDTGTLRVRRALQRVDGALILRDPKTEKSRRTLRLPAPLVTALRAHRDRQGFERAAAGSDWQACGLVFTTRLGTPIDPRNLLRSWHRLLADSGLERRAFHTTRHTAASLLIAEGVPMKVVQESARAYAAEHHGGYLRASVPGGVRGGIGRDGTGPRLRHAQRFAVKDAVKTRNAPAAIRGRGIVLPVVPGFLVGCLTGLEPVTSCSTDSGRGIKRTQAYPGVPVVLPVMTGILRLSRSRILRGAHCRHCGQLAVKDAVKHGARLGRRGALGCPCRPAFLNGTNVARWQLS